MPVSYPVTYRRSATSRGYQSTARAPLRSSSTSNARTPLQALQSSAWFRALPEGLAATLGLFGERLMEMMTQDLPPEVRPDAVPQEIQDAKADESLAPIPDPPWLPVHNMQWQLTSECPECLADPGWIGYNYGGARLQPHTLGTCCVLYGLASYDTVPDNSWFNFQEFRYPCKTGDNPTWSAGYPYRRYTNLNQGAPRPAPLSFPSSVPVEEPFATPEEVPNVSPAISPSVAPTPWELPIMRPGEIRNPEPLRDPAARPAVRPAQKPAEVGKIALPGPGFTLVLRPSAAPRVALNPVFPRPPRKNEREGKPHSRGAAGAIKFIANVVSEFRDFVEALWKAIPESFRSTHKPKLVGMIQQLGDFLLQSNGINSSEYWKEALVQLITNEIQDQFFGRAGKFNAKASANFFPTVPRGFQTGSAYRPKVPKEYSTDYLETSVRKVVDSIWP